MKQVTAFAPATVANVTCGFDIFGFALDTPGDEVAASRTDQPGVTIVEVTGDNGLLPIDATKNVAGIVAQHLLDHLQHPHGVALSIHKKMPIGSGLGSSAASAAAAVFAVNELLERPLSPEELIPFAMLGEQHASGAAHADNVAPSLLGGFVLIKSYHPLTVVPIPTPLKLHCPVLFPHVEVLTKEARSLLPKQIPLRVLVKQTANVAGLTLAMTQGDLALLGDSLDDAIAEPVRAALIPHYHAIKLAAMESGAIGCGISGSGPAIFTLCADAATADAVGKAMEAVCHGENLPCTLFPAKLSRQGARVIR